MPNPVIILWSTGQTVLACKWPESGTKPDCYVRNGFSFNYIVTDRLTLEIHNETEEVAGQYACSLVPPDHRTVKMCTLTVKGRIFSLFSFFLSFLFFSFCFLPASYQPFRDNLLSFTN